mgnify:CR=1 FL=1
MKEISRYRAKELIADATLDESNCDLLDLKVDFPYYDYADKICDFVSDGKISQLSEQNYIRIAKGQWFEIEFAIEFRPIYRLYIIDSLQYVTNLYLQKKLIELKVELSVTGDNEQAGKCPCCQYYSIDFGEDGAWDICPVCFWENGGNDPNHMTLEEAQQNFIKIGAKNESALKLIDPEGKSKYKTEHNNV